MKVLHVVPDLAPEAGGPAQVIHGMTQALAQAGAEVRLVATDHGAPGPPPSGTAVRLLPCRLCAWRWSPELGRILDAEARWADLVHLHTLWTYPIFAAARACRRAGTPYLLRPAGMLESWSLAQKAWKKALYLRLVEARTIAGARAVQFTSVAELEGSGRFGQSAPAVIVPLGVAPDAYSDLPAPQAFFRRHPGLEGRRLVLFLGRLHPKKQPDVALRAFHGIAAEWPAADLVLAGPGAPGYLAALREEARRSGLDARVHFLGMQSGHEVQQALVAATVFVLPSLQENFGLAVAEAMAAGCPVVVSRQVGLAQAVADAGAGLVVEPTEEAVAAALRQLLGDPALCETMGARGRRLVLERYTWGVVGGRLLSVYRELLGETG